MSTSQLIDLHDYCHCMVSNFAERVWRATHQRSRARFVPFETFDEDLWADISSATQTWLKINDMPPTDIDITKLYYI